MAFAAPVKEFSRKVDAFNVIYSRIAIRKLLSTPSNIAVALAAADFDKILLEKCCPPFLRFFQVLVAVRSL